MESRRRQKSLGIVLVLAGVVASPPVGAGGYHRAGYTRKPQSGTQVTYVVVNPPQ
jgi:hypothetical protein